MISEHLSIVDGSIYAYLLVNKSTATIVDWNALAQRYYKTGCNIPDIDTLFSLTEDGATISSLIKNYHCQNSLSIDHIFSFKTTEGSFACHIELCPVDDTHLFLVIHENNLHQNSELVHVVNLINNPIFVLTQDEALTITYQNERCSQYLNLENQLHNLGSTSFLSFLPKEKHLNFRYQLDECLDREGECDLDIEVTFGREYFQLFHLNVCELGKNKQLYGVLISVKKQSDLLKKIEYEQQYLDIVQKFTKDLLFRIDVRERRLIYRGDISHFMDLKAEVINFPECMRQNRRVHPDDLEHYISHCYRLMAGLETSFDVRVQLVNGTYEKYRFHGSPLVDSDGNTVQVVGKSENIQKLTDIEKKANFDALTATLNRTTFQQLFEDTIRRAVAKDKFALLFLDIDDFKGINDTKGHVFGDFILEAMSKRITNCIRKQDRLGRVGGDEFVVFFQFAPSHESVLERAEAILHSLRRDFNKEGETCKIKASIGISIFPEHGDTYDDLYHKADVALYQSKERGKDVATIYSPSFEAE